MFPSLIPGWRRVLTRALSVRLMLLAALLDVALAVLPDFADLIPANGFRWLSLALTLAAVGARVMYQSSLRPEALR